MKTSGNGIWHFLAASGVLDTGDDALIQEQKRLYYKTYKNNWQRQKRQREKTISYSLSKDELKIVKRYRVHMQNLSPFMKEAALSHCTNSYCIPDIATVKQIEVHIALIYENMTKLMEAEVINTGDCTRVIRDLNGIEERYFNHLRSPKTLLQAVTQEIRNNPSFKEILKKSLNI